MAPINTQSWIILSVFKFPDFFYFLMEMHTDEESDVYKII